MKQLFRILFILSLSLSVYAEEVKIDANMSLTDITGKTYKVTGIQDGMKIEGMEDKIVFLEFFGHQCPPCLASIPHLIELQKKHGDKLVIIAIEVQGYDSKETASFAKAKGINYITISSDQASDVIEYIKDRAQWTGAIPFLVVLNGKGEVQAVKTGMMSQKTLEKIIANTMRITTNKEKESK
jgi:thiol-disulfide isomerase/thioredoxin